MHPTTIQLERIRATLRLQFPGLDTAEVLDQITISISRKTGRIRGIFDRHNQRLFSLRNSDGRYVPTYAGGERMLAAGYRGNRITMSPEAAPFVAAGKSAFCKHVEAVDPEVVPQTEVLLIDRKDELLAVGTAQQPAYAMLELQSGLAAKVKHGR